MTYGTHGGEDKIKGVEGKIEGGVGEIEGGLRIQGWQRRNRGW